jgi:integrating conjugative element protein (TIGR03749 family)
MAATPTEVRPRPTAVDLGERIADTGQAAEPTGVRPVGAGALPPAQRAALAARGTGAKVSVPVVRRVARPAAGVERAVFRAEPIRVDLAVGEERLVTLPAPAALSVPTDIEHVARIEVIGPTIYVKALTPFHQIRIVAELVDSGQLIPMDFIASAEGKSLPELEVSVMAPPGSAGAPDEQARDSKDGPAEQTGADMVQLTRHAARQLYAPRRLAWTTPGVHQVDVSMKPVPALIRGINAEVVPLGQWKSGPLYVIAVRVTNRAAVPLEIPLEQLRGRWIAATAQHGRVGRAGTETDTTAIYLVCDR